MISPLVFYGAPNVADINVGVINDPKHVSGHPGHGSLPLLFKQIILNIQAAVFGKPLVSSEAVISCDDHLEKQTSILFGKTQRRRHTVEALMSYFYMGLESSLH